MMQVVLVREDSEASPPKQVRDRRKQATNQGEGNQDKNFLLFSSSSLPGFCSPPSAAKLRSGYRLSGSNADFMGYCCLSVFKKYH